MNINQETLDLIKEFEGWRPKAYLDPVGIPTIGYGHTTRAGRPAVRLGMVISEQEGEEILRRDLENFAKGVARLVTRPLNDNQFGALVSLAYNIGAGALAKSTALRLVNQGRFSEVPRAMAMFRKAGGKVLPGLVRRRDKEGKLFLKPAKGQGITISGLDGGMAVETTSATLSPGDHGTRVEMLQRSLHELGYPVGEIDGIFGSVTGAALLAFQQDNGLDTSGVADPATLAAISVAGKRSLDADRAGANAAELKVKGSEIVKRSERSWWAGLAAAVLGGSGFLQEKLPDVFKNIGSGVQGIANNTPQTAGPEFFMPLMKTVASLLGVGAGGPWVAVAGLGLYVLFNSGRIAKKRVEDHRSGMHLGR